MKRALILLLTTLLLCTACHDDKPEPASKEWRRVVVVCFWGENSLSSYLQRDLDEIRQGYKDIPDGCKLVVYFDTSRSSERPYILTFDAKEGEKRLYDYPNDPISTDSTAMQQMLGMVMSRFPSQHYGLVIGSHGSGWVPQAPRYTIGVDNGRNTSSNVGTEMEIPTLAGILRQTKKKWDYVVFDACFMQTVEVVYELRDVVQWCIGSPAEIPAAGLPYDCLMGSLFVETDEAWRIAEDYYDTYRDNIGLIISAVKTEELATLAQATAPLIARLPQFPPTEGIQRYYGLEYPGQWLPEFFDMGSAMLRWFGKEEYRQWLAALDRAVPHRYTTPQWETSYPYVDARLTDPDGTVALSMYIPVEGGLLNTQIPRFGWYRASGWH